MKYTFHSVDNEAINEFLKQFEEFINTKNSLHFLPFFSDDSSIVKEDFMSSCTENDICDWFNNNLKEETSNLSKAAITVLINSAILCEVTVHGDLHYYRIDKGFGENKLICNKHIYCSLANALELVKAFGLEVGQSITEGNCVVIILLSKITTKNLKTLEFKMVTKAHDFLVTICIKKGKSHNSKWRDTFIKYFECSGEVFEDHNDCFHLACLIDDMLSNEENDLTLTMSQDTFYSGTTLHYPEGISD